MSTYIKGVGRGQMSFDFMSLDAMVDENSAVRAIDAIVDMLNATKCSFVHAQPNETGRPSHDPVKMFKLYVYCYFEKIRSSRNIEKECTRNIEVMWLMDKIVPDHKCIANFRKDNKKAIKAAFAEFVEICDALGLLGKSMVAIDGSKFRANNARKQNVTLGKLGKKIEHFQRLVEEYNRELDVNDEKLSAAETKIEEAQNMVDMMKNADITEISLTDPDSRLMGLANGGYEVGYNVQNAVDSKAHIIVITDVVMTPADQGQLYKMAHEVTEILQSEDENPLTVLADKGYFEGHDIQKCEDDPKISAIVSRPAEKGNDGFKKSQFTYNAENDSYTCPVGQILHRTGNKKLTYENNRACKGCQFHEQCTKRARGRVITRNNFEEAMEAGAARFEQNKALYRERQKIVEHPFGTVKRTLGFTYFLTRGVENVKAENQLHMLTYNIKRVLNLFSVPDFMRALQKLRGVRQGNSFVFARFDTFILLFY